MKPSAWIPTADEIAQHTIAGALVSGWAEYWNPHTGAGLGAAPQSWTSLVAAMVPEPIPVLEIGGTHLTGAIRGTAEMPADLGRRDPVAALSAAVRALLPDGTDRLARLQQHGRTAEDQQAFRAFLQMNEPSRHVT